MIILKALGLLVLWYVLGCVVLASIDKDRLLFDWAKSCPIPFGYVLTILFFPIILFFWMKNK